MKTQRTRWNDGLIESEIRAVALSLGHFPVKNELSGMKREDLSNAICKSLGFVGWAKRLGMERAISDSDFGWAGEESVVAELQRRGFTASRTKEVKAPFDILVNNIVRIDVKNARFASYPTKHGSCDGWFYRLGKMCQADLVALHQYDEGSTYIIPWSLIPTSNVTITREGKYSHYKEAWWLVELLCSQMREFNTAAATVIGELAPSHG
jgi:hypothetical protein